MSGVYIFLPSSLRSGAVAKTKKGVEEQCNNHDWSKEAAAVFNNIRTPAALLSSASFAGINGAVLPGPKDKFSVGVAKRVYLLCAVAAFASNLLAVLVTTVAQESLNAGVPSCDATLKDFFSKGVWELYYVSTHFHFSVGVFLLLVFVGLKAWINFTCSGFATICLSLITSFFFLMLSFVPMDTHFQVSRYAELLVIHSSTFPPFLVASVFFGLLSLILLAWEVHLGSQLDRNKPDWALRSF